MVILTEKSKIKSIARRVRSSHILGGWIPDYYVRVCHKCTEMSGIYNLLSDVCVSSMDLFESLKLSPFGIGEQYIRENIFSRKYLKFTFREIFFPRK